MSDNQPVISVGQFLTLVNQTLRAIPTESFCVEGEVADFKISQGKWVNFCLKDETFEARLPCFMTTFQLDKPLADGMRVQARGYAKVFERFGKFSLNVEQVIPVGEGELAKAYALLKAKLTAEGLFEAGRKRSLPRFPARIGLITSKEAAAYGDFLRILGNRCGGLTVLHTPVHVQGQYAVEEICQAIKLLNELTHDERPEVIVLTRGGGSLEELHAFNDERTVRAVFGSAVPIIVGVGHERDETLCDFVADVRASTPSNAAERLVLDRRELEQAIAYAELRIIDRLQGVLDGLRTRLDKGTMLLERGFADIGVRIDTMLVRLTHVLDQFAARITGKREQVQHISRLLESLNPIKVLDRGYAIVRSANVLVRDAGQLAQGDVLSVQFAKGKIEAEVLGKRRQQKLL